MFCDHNVFPQLQNVEDSNVMINKSVLKKCALSMKTFKLVKKKGSANKNLIFNEMDSMRENC